MKDTIVRSLYTLVDSVLDDYSPILTLTEDEREDYERLSKKSTTFKGLDDMAKKSYLIQWVKEKSKDFEKITDEKERKRYMIRMLNMYKDDLKRREQIMKKRREIETRLGNDPIGELESSVAKSTDALTKKLYKVVSEGFKNKHFPPEAYFEFLINIRGKQYRDLNDLKGCIKQYSAFQSNVKTLNSIDFSTICPKRKEMVDMMARGVEITAANNPTCIYCYVESARDIKARNPKYFLAKAEKEDLRYQGELQNLRKTKVIQLNSMGGLRFFSSGDYIENATTDEGIEQMIRDAEKIGLQFKAITKQENFVKKYGDRVFQNGPLKGKAVFNINISVDEQRGFPLQIAKQIKKKSRHDNIKIRTVAFNPEQALKYAKDPDVDVITLLHFSSRGRMQNKELFVNMRPNSKGWNEAIDKIRNELGRDANKVLSKICCSTVGGCKECPAACGFNPRRVADFVQLAKGGKIKMKFPALVSK